MIEHHAIGKEKEVKQLLEKSLLHMNASEIHNWMRYQFQAESMYCFYVNNQLISVVQMEDIELSIQNQKIAANQITMAATHPDYRQHGYFTKLVNACLEQASYNTIFTLCTCNFPQLFIHYGFEVVSHTKTYWASLSQIDLGNAQNVSHYQKDMDLYPLYLTFISHFEGCHIYSKEQFESRLHYALSLNYEILILKKEEKIHGFALVKNKDQHIYIDVIVYLDNLAVLDCLAYLSQRKQSIAITIGQDERIEKIASFNYPRDKEATLVHVNQPKIFQRLFQNQYKSGKELYDKLKKPTWNHF